MLETTDRQMQRDHYQRGNALSVTRTLTGDTIKEKRKLSEKKMQSSSHSLIFMMGPLSSSHMPKMRLSLLSCFHLFIAFFQ